MGGWVGFAMYHSVIQGFKGCTGQYNSYFVIHTAIADECVRFFGCIYLCGYRYVNFIRYIK